LNLIKCFNCRLQECRKISNLRNWTRKFNAGFHHLFF
jgi:hypothetical protein